MKQHLLLLLSIALIFALVAASRRSGDSGHEGHSSSHYSQGHGLHSYGDRHSSGSHNPERAFRQQHQGYSSSAQTGYGSRSIPKVIKPATKPLPKALKTMIAKAKLGPLIHQVHKLEPAQKKKLFKQIVNKIDKLPKKERRAKLERMLNRITQMSKEGRKQLIRQLLGNNKIFIYLVRTIDQREGKLRKLIVKRVSKFINKHLGGKGFFKHLKKSINHVPSKHQRAFIKGILAVQQHNAKKPQTLAAKKVDSPENAHLAKLNERPKVLFRRFRHAIGRVGVRALLNSKIRISRGAKGAFLVTVKRYHGIHVIRVKSGSEASQRIVQIFGFTPKIRRVAAVRNQNNLNIVRIDEESKITKGSAVIDNNLIAALRLIRRRVSPLLYHTLHLQQKGDCLQVKALIRTSSKDQHFRTLKSICAKDQLDFIYKQLVNGLRPDKIVIRLGSRNVYTRYRGKEGKIDRQGHRLKGKVLEALGRINLVENWAVKELYRRAVIVMGSKGFKGSQIRWSTLRIRRGKRHLFVLGRLRNQRRFLFRLRTSQQRAGLITKLIGNIAVGEVVRVKGRGHVLKTVRRDDKKNKRAASQIKLDDKNSAAFKTFIRGSVVRFPSKPLIVYKNRNCLTILKLRKNGKKELARLCEGEVNAFYQKWTNGQECTNLMINIKNGQLVVKCKCNRKTFRHRVNNARYSDLREWLGLGFNRWTRRMEKLLEWRRQLDQESIVVHSRGGQTKAKGAAVAPTVRYGRRPKIVAAPIVHAKSIFLTRIHEKRYAFWFVQRGEVHSLSFELTQKRKRRLETIIGKDFEKFNFIRFKQDRQNNQVRFTLTFPDKTPARQVTEPELVTRLLNRIKVVPNAHSKYPTHISIQRSDRCFKLYRQGSSLAYKHECSRVAGHKIGSFLAHNQQKKCRKIRFDLPWIEVSCCGGSKVHGRQPVFGDNYDNIFELRDAPPQPPAGIVLRPIKDRRPIVRPPVFTIPNLKKAPRFVTAEVNSPFSILPEDERSFWDRAIVRTKDFVFFLNGKHRFAKYAADSDVISKVLDEFRISQLAPGQYIVMTAKPNGDFSVQVKSAEGLVSKRRVSQAIYRKVISTFKWDQSIRALPDQIYFKKVGECFELYASHHQADRINTVCRKKKVEKIKAFVGKLQRGLIVFPSRYRFALFAGATPQGQATKTGAGAFSIRKMGSQIVWRVGGRLRKVGENIIGSLRTKNREVFYGVVDSLSIVGLQVQSNLLNIKGNQRPIVYNRIKNYLRIFTPFQGSILSITNGPNRRLKVLDSLEEKLVRVPSVVRFKRSGDGCLELKRHSDGKWKKYKELCGNDVAAFHPKLNSLKKGKIRLVGASTVVVGKTEKGVPTELRRLTVNKFRVKAITIQHGSKPIKPQARDNSEEILAEELRSGCLIVERVGSDIIMKRKLTGAPRTLKKGTPLRRALKKAIHRIKAGKIYKVCLRNGHIKSSIVDLAACAELS